MARYISKTVLRLFFMAEAASDLFDRLRPVVPADRAHFLALYRRCGLLSCEYSFGNLLAWREIYCACWCEFRGATLIYLQRSDDLLFPVGAELEPGMLVAISQAFRSCQSAGAFHQAPAGLVARHPELGEYFNPVRNADCADYLHQVERLAELKGGKLGKKRNLIRQFERAWPQVRKVALGPEHAADCLNLTSRWAEAPDRDLWRIEREDEAIAAAFAHFIAGGFAGIGLYADHELLAFCLYSLMGETAVIHFEKAAPGIKGAAQAINQATAEMLVGHCRYLNREQDLGHPGLRQAKRSYDPDLMLVPEDLLPRAGR